MPSLAEIAHHDDGVPPPGHSPWVGGHGPRRYVEIAEPDPAWPAAYDDIAARIRAALGMRVLGLEHVGSTSVPGLPAKPIVDVDLVVADPADEDAWLPRLVEAGFVHVIREPWWQQHRGLRIAEPQGQVHVFGPDAAEPWRHRIFRDWLRARPEERECYVAAKRAAAEAANAAGEHTMEYNARKQDVIREIYGRAFAAAGITGGKD